MPTKMPMTGPMIAARTFYYLRNRLELDDEQLGEVSGGTATVNEDPTIVHT